MTTVTQDYVDSSTSMGANLVQTAAGTAGATFRVWAPQATAVYLNGAFNGTAAWDRDTNAGLAMQRIGGSAWWGGFMAGAQEGDPYKFYVVGEGTSGYKRDPYGRERDAGGNGFIRDAAAYPWHDQGFQPPEFSDMVIYQLHVGTFYRSSGTGDGTFLDVVEKLPYIAALSVNVLQLLPINEFETDNSMGYNGSDYYAPEFRYAVPDAASRAPYLATANGMLSARGLPTVTDGQIDSPYKQLKLLIDLCHLHGMAVHFDVVYNHAGGFDGDDESIFFWDRQQPGDNNRSLYFTAQSDMPPGGLPFALWKQEVRAFLIDNASYLAKELHVDGFRYDEVSLLVDKNGDNGWLFCLNVLGTLHSARPKSLHNAEFWQLNPGITIPAANGGTGFDATQNDGLREAIRGAVSQSAGGQGTFVDMDRLAGNLYVPGFPARWKAVQCAENHDIVYVNKGPRISCLADPSNAWSWYARSRSRVALGLLMTAPGIPQVFMGQEFLEDKQWSDSPTGPLHIYWDGLNLGQKPMTDFLRFSQELIAFRRRQPALSGENVNVFHQHDQNRVIAFHRWLEGAGMDIVVVATFSETTYYNYQLGFPGGGRWVEAFNSDVYDNWVNPITSGNGGGIEAQASPMHGFGYSASLTIPANGILLFSR